MNKYIDAEKLLAEIERRMENYNATIEMYYGKKKSIKAERDSWKWAECKWFLNLITSLQQEQPEVDIKKEIDELWKSLNTGHEYVVVDSYIDFLGICLHCFELGRNARKEE